MAERLWTTHGFGLPEDITLEGLVSVEVGRVSLLVPEATFVDHGRYGEVRLVSGNQDITVELVPQKRGVDLLAARMLYYALDKAAAIYERMWK